MHTPSDSGLRKEPVVAINSTPPPSAAAALAAQPGAPSATTGKPPAHTPGTPVFAPERLPSPAKAGAQPPQAPPSAELRAPAPRGLQGPADTGIPDLALSDGKIFTQAATPAGSGSATPADPAPGTPAARTRGKGNSVRTLPSTAQAALSAQLPAGQPFAAAADSAAIATAATASDPSASAPSAVTDSTRAAPPTPGFAPQLSARAAATPSPAAASTGSPPAAAPASGSPAAVTAATPMTLAPDPNPAPPAKIADTTTVAAGSASAQHGPDAASGSAAPGPDASALAVVLAPAHAASDPSSSAQTAASSAPASPIHTPVGASGWAEQIGARLVWMAHQGLTAASLRMQPEHLGPVEVKISVRDDGTSVWFGASQPETRAALEQALPQLRELFSAQGMTLTDAGVSREAPRETPQAQRPARLPDAPAGSENAASLSVSTPRRGLIDTYA